MKLRAILEANSGQMAAVLRKNCGPIMQALMPAVRQAINNNPGLYLIIQNNVQVNIDDIAKRAFTIRGYLMGWLTSAAAMYQVGIRLPWNIILGAAAPAVNAIYRVCRAASRYIRVQLPSNLDVDIQLFLFVGSTSDMITPATAHQHDAIGVWKSDRSGEYGAGTIRIWITCTKDTPLSELHERIVGILIHELAHHRQHNRGGDDLRQRASSKEYAKYMSSPIELEARYYNYIRMYKNANRDGSYPEPFYWQMWEYDWLHHAIDFAMLAANRHPNIIFYADEDDSYTPAEYLQICGKQTTTKYGHYPHSAMTAKADGTLRKDNE